MPLNNDVLALILLGADLYEADRGSPASRDNPRLGIGRDVVLDRAIIDKNARIGDGAKLGNEQGRRDYDGEGYYVRSGIIAVPKGAVIQPGQHCNKWARMRFGAAPWECVAANLENANE